ncbi:LLM class flavin-dependent oxidoreductase [Microlunatus soli]|uniref:Flavin-dependent oxidoreductase, luciferase family (Includes alkanesulfonate monooxygenase SsuD and methylene tetrahydromethanopterin reductase) n=1 Tax=Microlunatus soli TaxID=630515 RepID=A0A1H1PJB2_9ACTN|nr:LLM class flavin-dependent oxidoreductase [Microlunatus soli]SDS11224.1 Flavin-dependent oxidoreductase, luciferase family (includes alkanesulfonate monooxygenase SsuD and methylene tetrahydromethanopterin reductase) [Microlunatus soli]
MKFIGLTLGFNPEPRLSSKEKLDNVVAAAVWAEEAGLDGFGVGEHHTPDTEISSPPVILASIAARTTRLRLFTGVTVLSVLDPVRVAEDYATLDNLSDGRVEIIIGKGNTPLQGKVFGYDAEDQWDRNAEKYDLLHRLITEKSITWSGRYRPPLTDFSPRPDWLQPAPRIWHGSATSTQSTDLAARAGDPLFSANVTGKLEQYRDLVDDYRKRWADHGRDPADALVGAGAAAFHVAPTSQQAHREYEPYFRAFLDRASTFKQQLPFADLDEAIAGGSYYVGSPEQVLDKLHRYQQALGHEVQHVGDVDLTDPVRLRGLEAFATEVLPEARKIPDRLWEGPAGRPPVDDDHDVKEGTPA